MKMDNKVLNYQNIINQLMKYNISKYFNSNDDLIDWISQLNELQIKNILSLEVDPQKIMFSPKLLIDNNLLNTIDYIKRVDHFISIENADGWYHLFDYMLNPEFLNSEKFYQDIDTLKRAKSAQMPLWIIGDPLFIYSPYHDEDFQLLVTAEDTSGKNCDFVVWDAIATISKSEESIKSKYHTQDLQTIVKYGSKSLQSSHSYPEGSINNLAINKVSLQSEYHLQDMEILAQNPDIGNFLYAVMTNKNMINKNNYRRIIREMVENSENKSYVFLVCYYAIGKLKAKKSQNLCLHDYYSKITSLYNIEELLEKIDDKINTINGTSKDIVAYELDCNDSKSNFINKQFKQRKLIRKIFNKK